MFFWIEILGHVVELYEKRRRQQEEDRRYAVNDLEAGWEFKIVRTYIGTFRNPKMLQKLVDEEARAGWELLELFDDSRVRFKRRRSEKAKDVLLPPGINPYRTIFRMASPSMTVAWVILIGIVVGLFACTMIYVMTGL